MGWRELRWRRIPRDSLQSPQVLREQKCVARLTSADDINEAGVPF